MALDMLAVGIGFVIGALVTIFIKEMAERRIQNVEHSKLTAHWSLSENGGKPVKLVAERVGDVEVPPGSQVLIARAGSVPPEVARRCEVRLSDRVGSNFALADGKALVFAGAPKPGTLAVWTYELQVMERLALEWEHAWQASEPAVPRASVTNLRNLQGQTVEVVGSVSDVAEKGGVHYVRLIENGYTATVASSKAVGVGKGSVVRAIGTVEKALVGTEPVVRAVKVEAVRA